MHTSQEDARSFLWKVQELEKRSHNENVGSHFSANTRIAVAELKGLLRGLRDGIIVSGSPGYRVSIQSILSDLNCNTPDSPKCGEMFDEWLELLENMTAAGFFHESRGFAKMR